MARATKQARTLRRKSTPPERLLWSRLRNRQLGGFKFRRQEPVAGRILDFVFLERRLAIELDGSGHGYPSAKHADDRRTTELQKDGLRVVRFWNNEVLWQLDWVLDAILWELAPEKSRWPGSCQPDS